MAVLQKRGNSYSVDFTFGPVVEPKNAILSAWTWIDSSIFLGEVQFIAELYRVTQKKREVFERLWLKK